MNQNWSSVYAMSVPERKWFYDRLCKQKQKEAEAMAKASKKGTATKKY